MRQVTQPVFTVAQLEMLRRLLAEEQERMDEHESCFYESERFELEAMYRIVCQSLSPWEKE